MEPEASASALVFHHPDPLEITLLGIYYKPTILAKSGCRLRKCSDSCPLLSPLFAFKK
jgi:hypothetical protein